MVESNADIAEDENTRVYALNRALHRVIIAGRFISYLCKNYFIVILREGTFDHKFIWYSNKHSFLFVSLQTLCTFIIKS